MVALIAGFVYLLATLAAADQVQAFAAMVALVLGLAGLGYLAFGLLRDEP